MKLEDIEKDEQYIERIENEVSLSKGVVIDRNGKYRALRANYIVQVSEKATTGGQFEVDYGEGCTRERNTTIIK